MRLIDADALKEAIKECMTVWDEHSDYGNGRLRSYEWVLGLIDNASTVERPIRAIAKTDRNGDIKIELLRPHGEWIDYSNEGYVECPFCGSATNCEDNKDELHYCWNCGADLRGEEE